MMPRHAVIIFAAFAAMIAASRLRAHTPLMLVAPSRHFRLPFYYVTI